MTPGPEHISRQTAIQLRGIVNEIVERLNVSGADIGKSYQRIWSDFNAHFGIKHYRELPREKAEDGINYLHTMARCKRADSNSHESR